ncbi:transglycosylase domain-containing protein [Altererythrobacter sp. CC-YST694]|uniref:penicillin-binding protein 1A n=1 Tax=Altererythrobacter sp. CC-YST694 TaxID=2755038 RepID=UPI001D02CB05|nr:transglycosylase domain-containing protein [Altererythrobacter sp. CC-YST694]MCB5424610.1 transglycosylase domain-containing protein [Altererythrobacter sp. CC-YST694]
MSETNQSAPQSIHYRIRREAHSVMNWFRENWRQSPAFRWASTAIVGLLLVWLLVWLLLARNLPDAKMLLEYEPPLPTMVRGIDGNIVDSYARERRVQLQFRDFPKPLINAYLSAEDKTFWTHGGVDITGFAGAVVDYVSKIGSGQRARGGSTITQQVAKNILVGDEYSITRKLKEMLLARRIEGVLTKQQILELYLNEIPLGRRSFGVQAASRAYFGKDVGDLQLHEAAFLAILPKAPERYGRPQFHDSAIERRNWVLDEMVENGFVSRSEADAAKAQPLGLVTQRPDYTTVDAGYFMEDVRRQLIEKFGEQAEDGPNSVYAGGLWVRTSLDPELQEAGSNALRSGLLRYQSAKGWSGPIATIDMDKGEWRGQLQSSGLAIKYLNWRVGVVTSRSGGSARIGFTDGKEAPLVGLPDKLKSGDVVAATPEGNGWRIRSVPEISGGFLAEDPNTGRVLAMQGGFDPRLDSFNRATQALRQPGSTIKPFVYATGLDHGMTPATMVLDGEYCYYQGAALGEKCFRNFGGARGGGEHTMRWGLEQSRNLMTVHIAMDSGMPNVVKTIDRVGIGKYDPYPSFALGAGETTVARMVNAYSALVNHGLQFGQSTIDFVQDRRGKVIWRADKRECTGCNMPQWDGKPMPRLKPVGKQVLDPRTAFQVVHMLEGVVQRGTAVVLRDLNLPLFGKTGTTNGPTNVWFVGGSPDIVAGVYMGFDKPRNMGGYAQGGTIAAPIFKQFVNESRDRWNGRPFVAPAGIRMVRIDRATGRRIFGAWPTDDPKSSVIWEAFKPDTEPRRAALQDEIDAMRDMILAQLRRREQAAKQGVTNGTSDNRQPQNFAEEQGGLY